MKTLTVTAFFLFSLSAFSQDVKIGTLNRDSSYTLLYNFDSIANVALLDSGNNEVQFDSQYVYQFDIGTGIVITGQTIDAQKISYTILTQKDKYGNLLTVFDNYVEAYNYTSCMSISDCCTSCLIGYDRKCHCQTIICGGGTGCEARTFGIMPYQGISNAVRFKILTK